MKLETCLVASAMIEVNDRWKINVIDADRHILFIKCYNVIKKNYYFFFNINFYQHKKKIFF